MSEDLTRKIGAQTAVRAWLTEPVGPEVRGALVRLSRAPDVRRIAVMPDVHLGEASCVGVVLATQRLAYPQAVGGDIGCGVSALALDAEVEALAGHDRRERALRALGSSVPILRHRSIARAPEGGPDAASLSDPRLVSEARREGRIEFATLGRGNHFLEIQTDADDRLWLTVHSGSRVIGQAITRLHLERGERQSGGLVSLDTREESGMSYMNDLGWAVEFARASREAMLRAAADALEAAIGIRESPEPIWGTDHNHARFEEHEGERMLIHRKGASPAASDEPVIIPGSMASPTYHALGRGCEASLRSSSHGAGRNMSRGEAHRSISPDAFLSQTDGVTFNRAAAASLVDEAPDAYRDVRRVMRAQRDLVRIERTLTPIVCLKGV